MTYCKVDEEVIDESSLLTTMVVVVLIELFIVKVQVHIRDLRVVAIDVLVFCPSDETCHLGIRTRTVRVEPD